MADPGALVDLCGCLRGRPPARMNWMAVIGLANRTLTTPALAAALAQCPQRVPADAAGFFAEIVARNRRRNAQLAAQLGEAARALNAAGVTPVVMKGAAMLARGGGAAESRIITDLDILVAPRETGVAMKCLLGIGYRVHYRTPAGAAKWYVDLQRPQDGGMLDLHRAPPGPAYFYRTHGDPRRYCRRVSINGGTAYVPSATYEALMLVVHDAFQDSDYWVGAVDLRHLLDLRALVETPEGIDWRLLTSLARGRLLGHALRTQFTMLHRLLGVDVPPVLHDGWRVRLQVWRRLWQARLPLSRYPLLLLALLDYGNYRAELGRDRHAVGRRQRARLPRLGTIRFLFEVSRQPRPGKV